MGKISQRNYLQIFYAYCATNILNIIVLAYLPIYFFNVLNVDRVELAFVQFLSYSMLLLKPLISIYLDKQGNSSNQIKIYAIIGSIGMTFFFLVALISIGILLLFGVFLGIYFVFTALMDVSIDKGIVRENIEEKVKDKNSLSLQLGGLTGAIMANVFFLFTISDIQSLNSWNIFFLITLIFASPLVVLIFFFNPELEREEEIPDEIGDEKTDKIFRKEVLMMCFFMFIFSAEELYQYPLEPWAVDRLGEQNAWMISIFYIIFILIEAIVASIYGLKGLKIDKRKLFMISTFIYCVLTIIAPFLNIFLFFILLTIREIFTGFMLILLVYYMITTSKRKVIVFQIIGAFGIIGRIIFVPLGTALSSIIATEFIIAISSAIQLLAIIPLYYIKLEEI